jgi:DNA repair protein RadD
MDFAGNTERLGPINDVYVKKKQKRKGNGEPITKRCPNCDTIHHPSAKVCEFCGHKFQFKEQIRSEASSKEIINDGKAHWYNITDIHYKIHSKRNAPDMLKVEYQSGLRFFNEYVCIEHPGYAGYRAKHWAKFRGVESAHNAQSLLQHSKNLKKPTRIKVDTNQKYPVIVDYEF